jgi:3-oxoadipate enol-lactonase
MRNSIFNLLLLSFFLFNCEKKTDIQGIAEVNGTKLYYEVSGKGEPLVLVHGNGGDRRHWDFQMEDFSKEFKVIRYDVRGYGKSALPDPEIEYSNRDDLKALLDYLNIEKAHVCGLSMGSGIAVTFALTYPEMCISLIPIGAWAGGYGRGDYRTVASDSLSKAMGKVGPIAFEKGAKEATDYFLTGNDVFRNAIRLERTVNHMKQVGYEYSYWGFMNRTKKKSLPQPAISVLDKIKIPTLIVIGEYDLGACIEVADIMEKEIEGSKKVVMKDAGHCMNIDKPEEFNKLVIDFIKNLD